MSPVRKAAAERPKMIPVSELNLRKAGTRLLANGLVSTEVAYLQRELGAAATQAAIDAKVLAVRALPWAEIALAD